MVKPIVPSGSQTGQVPSATPNNNRTSNSVPPAQPIYQGTPPSLQNLRGGGQAGAGSVVTDRQRVEAYRGIEGELDLASRALADFRRTGDIHFLSDARTHLNTAQNTYRTHFPSSEGSFMVRDGNRMTTFDVGNLNTRLNMVALSLRRSEQVAEASH